jgi:uncharacterized membrane protein YgcG
MLPPPAGTFRGMRRERSVPALAFWAGGVASIVAAALVLSSSVLAAIALVVVGFGLVGVYWVREHPRGVAHRMGWLHGGQYYGGEGGEGSGDGGGGGGDGGGGGGGDGGGGG